MRLYFSGECLEKSLVLSDCSCAMRLHLPTDFFPPQNCAACKNPLIDYKQRNKVISLVVLLAAVKVLQPRLVQTPAAKQIHAQTFTLFSGSSFRTAHLLFSRQSNNVLAVFVRFYSRACTCTGEFCTVIIKCVIFPGAETLQHLIKKNIIGGTKLLFTFFILAIVSVVSNSLKIIE